MGHSNYKSSAARKKLKSGISPLLEQHLMNQSVRSKAIQTKIPLLYVPHSPSCHDPRQYRHDFFSDSDDVSPTSILPSNITLIVSAPMSDVGRKRSTVENGGHGNSGSGSAGAAVVSKRPKASPSKGGGNDNTASNGPAVDSKCTYAPGAKDCPHELVRILGEGSHGVPDEDVAVLALCIQHSSS